MPEDIETTETTETTETAETAGTETRETSPETQTATEETEQTEQKAETTGERGDLNAALHAERTEKRELKERIAALEEQLGKKPEMPDLSKFHFTDDDLTGGDATALNAKLEGALKEVLNYAHGAARATGTAATTARILDSFEIFRDPVIGKYAQFEASEALRALPDGAGEAAVREAVEKVAQEVSKMKADAQPPSTKGGKPPAPSGGGGATTSHLKPANERPKNDAEASALSAKMAEEKRKSLGLKE